MDLSVWHRIAQLGLHVNPFVVEQDRWFRTQYGMPDAVLNAQLLAFAYRVSGFRHRGAKCITSRDLETLHGDTHWALYRQYMCYRRERINNLRSLLRMAHLDEMVKGDLVADVQLRSDESGRPPNVTALLRLIERFGFCPYCAETAWCEVALHDRS